MTTGFIILAAGCVLVALAFVIVPLLIGRNERGGAIPILILAMILLVPAASWITYRVVGTPEGIAPQASDAAMIRSALIDIANRLERNPDDADNWVRMAMAYKELEEYSSAEHAFRRALFIDEGNPFIQIELAETMLFESGRPSLPQPARELLDEALETDPEQQKAVWLLGLDAFQQGNYDEAVARFERLDGMLPDGNVRNTVRSYLQQAQQRRGDPATTGVASDVIDDPQLTVSLALDESLAEQISGEEAVFVIVRSANGARAPLAVHRITAGELPTEVTFDRDDTMMGGAGIGDVDAIRITARISHSGVAEAQSGDFEGTSDDVPVTESISARVLIDRTL